MAGANVMVVFWSRLGATERLGLAAALGAVQGRGNIRLRWLKEEVADAEIDAVPGWRENRERMLLEYIAPRPIDLEWATGLVLVTPGRADSEAGLWRGFFALGPCAGKQCAAVGPLIDAIAASGLSLAGHHSTTDSEGGRLLGRRVADLAGAR